MIFACPDSAVVHDQSREARPLPRLNDRRGYPRPRPTRLERANDFMIQLCGDANELCGLCEGVTSQARRRCAGVRSARRRASDGLTRRVGGATGHSPRHTQRERETAPLSHGEDNTIPGLAAVRGDVQRHSIEMCVGRFSRSIATRNFKFPVSPLYLATIEGVFLKKSHGDRARTFELSRAVLAPHTPVYSLRISEFQIDSVVPGSMRICGECAF